MTVPLQRIGEALYGEQWKSSLARAVGVNHRTMQRWAAGKNPIPDHAVERLHALLTARHAELAALLAEWRKAP